MSQTLLKKSRTKEILAAAFFIASPLIIMLILSLLSGNNMFLSKPYLNDEIDYWRVMYSVKECGLRFGSTGGLPGRSAPIGPLEAHGLGPLASWLWYVLLFPMGESSLVIANFLMLTSALAVFWLLLRPDPRTSLLLAGFTLLFPPIIRYINLSMMEIPCYAGCVVYLALLCRYEEKPSFPRLCWVFAAALYCSVLRMSNVVLFLPVIFIFCRNKFSFRLFALLAAYVFCILLLNKFINAFISPYPDFVSSLSYCSSYGEMISVVLNNVLNNLRHMVNPFSDASVTQALARYQYLLLLVLFMVLSFLSGSRQGKLRPSWNWTYLGMLGVVAGCFALVIVLYDVFDWRDYRTLSPILYVALLWLLLHREVFSRRCRRFIALIALLGVVMAPSAYLHVAGDNRFFDTGLTGLDYSCLFDSEPCTLALYGDSYPLALAMSVPPQVGVSSGLYDGYDLSCGIDYILCRPGDPVPPPESYALSGQMEGYGTLYKRIP